MLTAFGTENAWLIILLLVEGHKADDYLDLLIGGRIPSQSSPLYIYIYIYILIKFKYEKGKNTLPFLLISSKTLMGISSFLFLFSSLFLFNFFLLFHSFFVIFSSSSFFQFF